MGSAGTEADRAAYDIILARRDRFDDQRFGAFYVSIDPEDHAQDWLGDLMPGVGTMWNFDRSVSRMLGAAPIIPAQEDVTRRPSWILVDPSLHVLATIPFDGGREAEALFDRIDALPHPSRFAGFEVSAPVLVLPNVFDQPLCRHLIGLYDRNSGGGSGVMWEGVGVLDRSFKSCQDYTIEDEGLIRQLQAVISRCVLPENERLFFRTITRMERNMIGRYAAE